MKSPKRLTLTLALTLVLATVAFAGEVNTPPCVPGEMGGPPCPSQPASENSVIPGQTGTPPAANSGSEFSFTDLALEVIELAVLF
jgi:hypothetical protein